jgi:hypothetical protein
MFKRDPLASDMETDVGSEKTLDGISTKKTMRQRKELMKELGFFTLAKSALFISTY